MKLYHAAALALLSTAPFLASASSFSVDFEKSWDYLDGDVNGYYGGGTAADGTSGPDLGVTFINVSGLSNDPSFPAAYSGAPSPLGVAYSHTFATGDKAVLNVAGFGASNALSFYYSSPVDALGAIQAWSGLNGTGTLLGTIDLLANNAAYDVWTLATLSFAGVAQSFDLTGSANAVAFDNIATVPEPGMALMMLGGVGALVATRSRRRV